MSLGKGSGNNSSNQSGSVWDVQAGFLGDLFSGASDQLGSVQGTNNQIQQGAQQSFLNQVGGGTNPFLAQMGQSGLNLLNDNFDRNLNQITGNSVAAGNLGSSRQGVAQGLALEQNNQQSSDFINNLYGGQYQQDQNRAASVLPFANQIGTGGFAPYQQLGGIFGSPTVLNKGTSQGRSSNFSLGL